MIVSFSLREKKKRWKEYRSQRETIMGRRWLETRLRRNYREKGSAVASDSEASISGRISPRHGETPAPSQVPVMNSSGSRGIFRKYLRPATSFFLFFFSFFFPSLIHSSFLFPSFFPLTPWMVLVLTPVDQGPARPLRPLWRAIRRIRIPEFRKFGSFAALYAA